mgnify:CR=1 FL=1|jgi:hypothetical protein
MVRNMTFKSALKLLGPIALSLNVLPALANLEQLTFTDTNGVVTNAAASKEYINPVGKIEADVSVGSGRYIILKAQHESAGAPEFEYRSKTIGSKDTIAVNGSVYPGIRVTLPNGLANEGKYVWTIDYYSGKDLVSTEQHEQIVDRQAPVVTDYFGHTYGLGRGSSLGGRLTSSGQVAPYEAQRISAVIDSEFEQLASAEFTSVYVDGAEAGNAFITKPAALGVDSESGKTVATIGGATTNALAAGGYYPAMNGRIISRFKVVDKAGNIGGGELEHYLHWICNGTDALIEPIGVYNPSYSGNPVPGMNFTGYEPYVSGMAVTQNPFRILYRMPLSKGNASDPQFGYWFTGGNLKSTSKDSNYIYYIVESDYVDESTRFQGHPNILLKSKSFWQCSAGSAGTKLTRGEGVPESPNFRAIKYSVNGEWIGGIPRTNTSDGIVMLDRIQITADARPYEQVWSSVLGSCRIPIGETVCIAEGTKTLGVEGGIQHYHQWTYVRSADNKLESRVQTINARSDLQPPIFDYLKFDVNAQQYELAGTELNTGAYWGDIKMRSGHVYLVNKASGAEIQLKQTSWVTSGDQSIYQFTIDSVPDGEYAVRSLLRDWFGNDTVTAAPDLVIDNAPPTVAVTELPNDGMQIKRLDELTILVNDNVDSDPLLISARLQGGPDNIDYQLPREKQESGVYQLGVPAITPDNQTPYRLTLEAKDNSNNQFTLERVFYFNPPMVSNEWGATTNAPTTKVAIYQPGGKHSTFYSQPLLDSDDLPITGKYEVTVSVRGNATTAVEVNGIVIEPGGREVVANLYDMGANESRLILPVRPLEENASADIVAMINSLQAPGVMFTLTSNVPEFGVVASNNRPMQLEAVQFSSEMRNNKCVSRYGSTANLRNNASANPLVEPVCFFDWTNVPPYTIVQDSSGDASAKLEDAGPVTVESSYYMMLNGEKVEVGAASLEIEVVPFAVEATVSSRVKPEAEMKIEDYVFALDNPKGCNLTSDPEQARSSSQSYCLIEWLSLPDGFTPYQHRPHSEYRGNFQVDGEIEWKWRIGGVARSGSVIWAEPQSYVVLVDDPIAPEVEFMKGRWLENGELAASYGETQPVITVRNVSPADINVTVESPVFTDTVQFLNRGKGSYSAIPGYTGAMWQVATYKVITSYTKYPEKARIDEFQVRLMPSPNIYTALNGARSAMNIEDYSVDFSMGAREGTKLTFSSEYLGDWAVHLAFYRNGELVRLTDDQQMVPEGLNFTIKAEQLQELEKAEQRFYAVATLDTPDPALARTILSRAVAPRVYNGLPIEGVVTATVTQGPAKLSTRLRLQSDRDTATSLGEMQWQVSSDNAAWQDIPDANRSTLIKTMGAGDYYYRVRMKNRYSEAVSYTDPVYIWVYEGLGLELTGHQHTIPGVAARIEAQAVDGNGNAVSDAEYEWVYQGPDGKNVTVPGKTINYVQNVRGTKYLTARVRRKGADPLLRQSWETERYQLVVDEPKAPRVSLRGPSMVEVGPPYQFTADSQPSWRNRSSTQSLAQEWVTPDGKTVSGANLNWSPTDELMEAVGFGGYTNIVHRAWMVGHKEATLRESYKRVRIWKYEWPEFYIKVSQRYDAAPSSFMVEARPDDIYWYRRTFGEEISYRWTLPSGADIESQYSNRISLFAERGGSYDIEVVISDTRGNSQTATATVVLQPTPAYSLALSASSSNSYWRAPMELSPRLSVSGGHPENRVTAVKWFLNNQQLQGVEGTRPRISVVEPGNYSVEAKVETELGVTSRASFEFVANANQTPYCTLAAFRSGTTVTVDAACKDDDGSVVEYTWKVDGEAVATTSRRISFSRPEGATIAIQLTARDDSGAIGTVTQNISP